MQEETRICQNCRQNFAIEQEDFKFYAKIDVPPPTFCPECRRQRRLSWRNDLYFYSRDCDLCKKPTISLYSSDKPFPVYCVKCWWSDAWDPFQYGREYDFSRPFFEQFNELQIKVPHLALINDNGVASVNCEYTQDFAFGKNCYLVMVSWKIENCLYGYFVLNSKDIVDSINIHSNCEFLYESINVQNSYNSIYIYNSSSLMNCAFCYDCRDSSNCFLSIGLRHKRYYIKNKPYTKTEYEKILANYELNTHHGIEKAKKEFLTITLSYPHRFSNIKNCFNCKGDDLYNCKNSYGFNLYKAENCKFYETGDAPKDSYDMNVGGELSECYEGLTPDHSYRGLFTVFSWKNSEVSYCIDCHSSNYLFGCIGLKKAKCCILNKQYSKESFQKLKANIIDEMDKMPYKDNAGKEYRYGEFFPSDLSPFGYNETIAQLDYPYTKNEALNKNFRWQDTFQFTTGKETISFEHIPDNINDVSDSIINEVLACKECGRNYRVIPSELSFYRKMQLPLPRKCFYCRHANRLRIRNPYRVWYRQCQCAGTKSDNGICNNTVEHFHKSSHCPNEFETTYSPERQEIIYCEKCYLAEVA
ncbi:MAG: hypothetical protein HY001_04195 [Candidatus Portnoybacteria bacterium]|nr:hypothetical protein [Candidatus Portnoybacteria bacterium]